MGLSLKPDRLRRYAAIARLLIRYGHSDLVSRAGLDEALADEDLSPEESPDARDLAADLERMGPTYVKLGQLLSTRVDLLPLPYTEALSRLQDSVDPFPFAEAAAIVEDELGVRMSKAFLEFEEHPIAAASLGQVHRARLRDGRWVAVKVQRPDVRARVTEDLDIIRELVGFLDRRTELGHMYDLPGVADEMRRTLLRELDYRQEAANLVTLSRNLAEFDRIVVPLPVHDYSSSRVLTMELVRGRKITSIGPLARMEMDGDALAEELFRAYLKQILVDGFFHADPHPGNVFLTDDRRIALIDVGMVGRLTPALQDELLRLLLANSEGRGEETAEILVGLGDPREGFDRHDFEGEVVGLVVRYRDVSAEQLQIGRVMLEVTRSAGEFGLRLPTPLTMLGKTLLNLDQVGRVLDPEFEPNAAVRRHSADLMRRRMLRSASPTNAVSSLLEMNEFVQRLPWRVNRALDAVADREIEFGVRVTNDAVLLEGLQKVANRIAAGLVLAALIVGAAMLMQVETSFRIFGYPGLAMLFFLAAAVGGVTLLIDVLAHDRRSRRTED